MPLKNAILLVEDNEDDVFIMRRALKGAGVGNPLYVVENGQKAIEYLTGAGDFRDRERHPLPAIVFLDLQLPLLSGHDVLRRIRALEDFDALVVVVLTSSEEPEDVRKAYALGANSYLVKPPTTEQLLEMAKAFKWYWLELNEFAEV